MDDLHKFGERLKRLYSHWEAQRLNLWGSSDVLTFTTFGGQEKQITEQSTNEETLRQNTLTLTGSLLSKWLFGRVFDNSVFVFTRVQIYCMCTSREMSFLRLVGPLVKETVGADFQLYVKQDNDDGSGVMDDIIRSLHVGARVGYIRCEMLKGDVPQLWRKKLTRGMGRKNRIQLVDASRGLSHLLSVKNNEELQKIKKSAWFTTQVMKKLMIPEVDKAIKGKVTVFHSSMGENTLKAIQQVSEEFSLASPPVFQSGECVNLNPCIPNDKKELEYNSQSVVVSSVGSIFEQYCSFIARTFLIDPSPLQIKAYKLLYQAHEAAIKKLKPGNKLSDVYEAAVSVVKEDHKLSCKFMTKHAGSGIGLELNEPGFKLDGRNGELVREGMVFNVSLGFQNLQSNENKKPFSLWIADSVLVDGVGPHILTAGCSKAIEDVTLPLIGGETHSEFVMVEDADDVTPENGRKEKRREMECEMDEYGSKGWPDKEKLKRRESLVKQLHEKVKKKEALEKKAAELKVAYERNNTEYKEKLSSMHVIQEKLKRATEETELGRQAH